MRKAPAIRCALALALLGAGPAWAERISNPVAVFSGLDKVTGNITSIEIPVDKSGRFGTLEIRPRVCYSRPVTEEPKTTSFVEINDIDITGQPMRVFTGWMFAESPALNALEHPVFDVWLTACKDPAAPAPKVEEVPPGSLPSLDAMPKDND